MRIYPSEHRLKAVDNVIIKRIAEEWPSLRFLLDAGLKIKNLQVDSKPAGFKTGSIEALGYLFKVITVPKKLLPMSQREINLSFSYDGEIFDPGREEKGRIIGKIDNEDLYLYLEPYPWISGTRPVARLAITLPKDWAILSSGQLIGTKKEVTETTYFYEMKQGEKALVAAAKDYVVESYPREGELSFSTYLFSEHAREGKEWIEASKKIIEFYFRTFGPYPFKKFVIGELRGPGGGAGAGIILVATEDVSSGAYQNVGFLAHEISHQWWGVSVCAKDLLADAWLNEGFATYSELIYFEHLGRKDESARLLQDWATSCRRLIAKGTDEPLNSPHTTEAIFPLVYDKGAYVLHMLRKVVGNEKFFAILQEYFRQHQGTLVTTNDFQKICEGVTGEKLDWFFEQWTRLPGAPELELNEVRMEKRDGSFLIKGHLLQRGQRIFKVPAEILLTTQDQKEAKCVVWSEKEDTEFLTTANVEPKAIRVDPENNLLKIREVPGMTFVDGQGVIEPEEKKTDKEEPFTEVLQEEPGVITVQNPEKGLWAEDGSKEISLKQVASIIGTPFLSDSEHVLHSIAVDISGNIYLLEGKLSTGRRGFGCIKKFDREGKFLANIAKKGKMLLPSDLAVASDGTIYVPDYEAAKIEKFSADGEYIGSFPLPVKPNSIALDSENNIYVVPNMFFGLKKNLIFRFDKEGKLLGSFGKTLQHRFGDRLAAASLNKVSICSDSGDNLYVSYSFGYKVQKYSRDGKLLAQFNRKLPYPIYYPKWTRIENPDGTSGGGIYTYPATLSIACDSRGYTYVLLAGKDREEYKQGKFEIDIFDRQGTYLSSLKIAKPNINKIYLDKQQNLYLLDGQNEKRVYKFHLEISGE
jgi:hypothetical protein